MTTQNKLTKTEPSRKKTVIKNDNEFEDTLAETVRMQMRRAKIQLEFDEEINTLSEKYKPELKILDAELKLRMATLSTYAGHHRGRLLPGEEKSADAETCTWGFRKAAPALKTLKGWTWGAVAEALSERKLYRFLMFKPAEANRDLIKRELPTSEMLAVGVEVVEGEDFFVEANAESKIRNSERM